jgi:molybdopterin-guanine dinucleotide biosynthesis protein A
MRGAILAGGMATRFDGKPKGLEVVGGERILNRTADILKAVVGSPPLLVANAPDADTWYPGLEVTKDLLPERGSLGGIYTALAHGDGPVLLLAWGMPFVSRELLVALRDGSSGHDVFLPESRGPRGVEPLCGGYIPRFARGVSHWRKWKSMATLRRYSSTSTPQTTWQRLRTCGADYTPDFCGW